MEKTRFSLFDVTMVIVLIIGLIYYYTDALVKFPPYELARVFFGMVFVMISFALVSRYAPKKKIKATNQGG